MRGDMRKVSAAAVGLLLAMAAAGAGAGVGAEAPWPCEAVEAEGALTWDTPLVWWDAGGGDFFAQLQTRDGSLALRGIARFHPVGERFAPRPATTTPQARAERSESESASAEEEEGAAPAAVVQVCVGLTDTTAYTSDTATGDSNVAWVTLHTDPLHPVAIVEMPASCWSRSRSVRECRPRLRSTPRLQTLPLYRFSPLTRTFWTALAAPALPADAAPGRPWLRRYNAASKTGRSVRASWPSLARLPHLRAAELTGNDWGETPPHPMALLEVVELRLHDNNLTSLPDDFATFMPKLETLVLAKNRLSRIPSSLVTLQYLHLLDVTNPLSPAVSFSLDYIADIPNLRILGLENQQLEGNILPVMLMPTLQFLNLSGCGLQTLGDGTNLPRHATELQLLDLSNNNLEAIPGPLLDKFPKLGTLLLKNNRFQSLGDSYWVAPKLIHLDLSHNHLKTLPKIRPLKAPLKTLSLHDNMIEKFEDDFWESLTELENLDLSHNLLTASPKLKYQTKLQRLDLSRNELKLLHGSDFVQMNQLSYLNASNNLLASVNSNILQFPQLKTVDISNNRLWYVRISSSSIEAADFSNNLLTSFPTIDASHLLSLQLATNLITYVNLSVGAFPNLRELDLSRNQILQADLGELTLQKVDLSHNKLDGKPLGSSAVAELKMEFNSRPKETPEDALEASSNDWWDTWYIYVIAGAAVLGCLTVLLLIGVAVVARKLLRRDEPLVLPTSFRTPSPACLSEPSHVRFK